MIMVCMMSVNVFAGVSSSYNEPVPIRKDVLQVQELDYKLKVNDQLIKRKNIVTMIDGKPYIDLKILEHVLELDINWDDVNKLITIDKMNTPCQEVVPPVVEEMYENNTNIPVENIVYKIGDKSYLGVNDGIYYKDNKLILEIEPILGLIIFDNDKKRNPEIPSDDGYGLDENPLPGGLDGSIHIRNEQYGLSLEKHFTNFNDINTTVFYDVMVKNPSNNKKITYTSKEISQDMSDGYEVFPARIGRECETKTIDEVIELLGLTLQYAYDKEANILTIIQ